MSRYMTSEEFKKIKTLQKAGLTVTQTKSILGRSVTPIATAFESEDFPEYQNRTSLRYKGPVKQASKAISYTPPQHDPELIVILKSIDSSLKFLVDHLPVPEKRRLFR